MTSLTYCRLFPRLRGFCAAAYLGRPGFWCSLLIKELLRFGDFLCNVRFFSGFKAPFTGSEAPSGLELAIVAVALSVFEDPSCSVFDFSVFCGAFATEPSLP